MNQSAPITVWITRTVKPGREPDYEQAMHEFAQRSLELNGQLGVHINRPVAGSGSRDYRVVRKFDSREALESFKVSALYREWNDIVRELTEGKPRFEELAGLESWFTPPGVTLRPLPKWKMASVTFVAVYPLTSLLPPFFGRWLFPWHPLLINLVTTGAIVTALSWVIMPLITRILRGWLHS